MPTEVDRTAEPTPPLAAPPRRRRVVPQTIVRAVGLVTVLAVLILLARYEGPVLLLVFAGFLFAVTLKGISRLVSEKTHLPYKATLAILVVLLLGGTALFVWRVGPSLAEQARSLSQELPRIAGDLRQKIEQKGVLDAIGGTPDIAEMKPEPKEVAAQAGNAILVTTEAIGGLVAIFFLGVYGAADPGAYNRAVLTLVPPARRRRVAEVLDSIDENLTRWLLGRLVAMASVGVMTGVGMAILGVPMTLALAILAALLTFIEYLGAVASAVPAILLALVKGGTPMALWVLVIFTAAHIVEGYVLTPILAKKAVHFPPAITLASQLVFGAVFGVAGLTFATPVGAIVAIVAKKLYVEDVLGDPPLTSRRSTSPT